MSNHLAPSIDYTVVKNLVSSSEYQGFVDYIEAPSKGGKILKGSQQKNSHGHLYRPSNSTTESRSAPLREKPSVYLVIRTSAARPRKQGHHRSIHLRGEQSHGCQGIAIIPCQRCRRDSGKRPAEAISRHMRLLTGDNGVDRFNQWSFIPLSRGEQPLQGDGPRQEW